MNLTLGRMLYYGDGQRIGGDLFQILLVKHFSKAWKIRVRTHAPVVYAKYPQEENERGLFLSSAL